MERKSEKVVIIRRECTCERREVVGKLGQAQETPKSDREKDRQKERP